MDARPRPRQTVIRLGGGFPPRFSIHVRIFLFFQTCPHLLGIKGVGMLLTTFKATL